MRRALALFLLGLSALAQEVVVYPGFAEVKEPVDLPPSAWAYLAGEKLSRILPGSLRLLGVEETERVFQGSAVLFRYRGEGKAVLRYLYTGLSGEVFYTLEEGTLTAWARLRLEGEALRAERLTLLAGEVRAKALPQVAFRALEEAPGSPFGLFRYELPPRTLSPGTTELPFLKKGVAPERLLRYQGPFRTERLLPLERGYRFRAPFPLAPGGLEVVEGGLFLGQALLPATPEGRWRRSGWARTSRPASPGRWSSWPRPRRRPPTGWRPAWKTPTPTPWPFSSRKPSPGPSAWTSPGPASCPRGTASRRP